MYGKESRVEVSSLSIPVSNNYLDFTSESVKPCTEYEFVVQAVSNTSRLPLSLNSSTVSGVFITGNKYVHL